MRRIALVFILATVDTARSHKRPAALYRSPGAGLAPGPQLSGSMTLQQDKYCSGTPTPRVPLTLASFSALHDQAGRRLTKGLGRKRHVHAGTLQSGGSAGIV